MKDTVACLTIGQIDSSNIEKRLDVFTPEHARSSSIRHLDLFLKVLEVAGAAVILKPLKFPAQAVGESGCAACV